ncbi:MAG: carbohydrate binding family 9 domain-containing protein [Gemmatimonadota bacterium]|nr:carbohydrate binding family 9 domain-containing protein [Gemmatimonadota bacterium]
MLASPLVLLTALFTIAQSDTVAPKRLRATRVPDGAIRVDGRLTEPSWRSAEPASGFVQREPVEGSPASERTEVAVLYDDEALYVGARLYSRDPRAVRALVTRRDREGSSEQLIVSLDTYRDKLTAYTFAVTPAGVRIDYHHSADFESRRDYSYDPVWEARTAIDSLGWTAEFRIPFAQLRFNPGSGEQVWGVNLVRKIPAANEAAYWILVPRGATGWSSRFGELVGIAGIRASRRAELVPYVASDARLQHVDDPRNPFAADRKAGVRAGGDVKMGVGPGLTLDATFNPDFGQVEADPAEVNLSAFETFFAERRPFFVEGAQLFQPSGPGWFYSRRIGASPRAAPDADYVEELRQTTILGAAKVTGRLPSGLSVAVLAALTDREYARFVDTAYVDTEGGTGALVPTRFGRVAVAPRTGYGVVRLQQQFGANASTAGVILTGVRRDLSARDFTAAVLARDAYSGGVDWRLRWKRGEYDWSGFAGLSHIAGDTAALGAIQRSSRHYFQRPDARHVRLDPLRTTLSGFTAGTGVSKLAGNWRWDADVITESPSFELNDVGRLTTADGIESFGGLRYLHTRPGRTLHNWAVGVNASNVWNYDWVRNSTYAELNADATLKNFWEVRAEVWTQPRALNDRLTRGGPLMQTGRRWGGSASLENSSGEKTQWEVDAGVDRDELGGHGHELEASLTLRPGTQWEVSLEPGYFARVAPRQYVTTLDRMAGDTATYGKRYVFAFIDRSELALRTRLNYAVRPDLTIESYAEPFVSSGRYYGFGELAAPRSRMLRSYGTDRTAIARNADGSYTVTDTLPSGAIDAFPLDNGDFDVLSFRSNVVLRWEWRLGSTLYLVWQQDRHADDDIARPVRPGRLWRAMRSRGANLFAVKVTYWLPVR